MKQRKSEAQRFGERLKALLDETAVSPGRLAKHLEISSQAVDNWLQGKNLPSTANITKIAKVLRLPIERLFTEPEPHPTKVIQVPGLSQPVELDPHLEIPNVLKILGAVCAGNGLHPAETVELHIGNGIMMEPQTFPIGADVYASCRRSRNNKVYCVVVSGHSMEPECHDGEILIVERTENLGLVRDKDLVIVDLDGTGNYTLKQYRKGTPGNPDAPPLLMPINQDAGFSMVICTDEQHLWGIVIGQFRPRR